MAISFRTVQSMSLVCSSGISTWVHTCYPVCAIYFPNQDSLPHLCQSEFHFTLPWSKSELSVSSSQHSNLPHCHFECAIHHAPDPGCHLNLDSQHQRISHSVIGAHLVHLPALPLNHFSIRDSVGPSFWHSFLWSQYLNQRASDLKFWVMLIVRFKLLLKCHIIFEFIALSCSAERKK